DDGGAPFIEPVEAAVFCRAPWCFCLLSSPHHSRWIIRSAVLYRLSKKARIRSAIGPGRNTCGSGPVDTEKCTDNDTLRAGGGNICVLRPREVSRHLVIWNQGTRLGQFCGSRHHYHHHVDAVMYGTGDPYIENRSYSLTRRALIMSVNRI